MLRNPQWNKIIYSGCRTTQLLWTDGMLTTEETGGKEDGASTWEWRRFLSAGYVLSTQVKLPYSFIVILNTLTFNECIVITLLFFLKWTWPIQKNGRIKWRSWCHPFNPIPSLFFHTHSHMQTFMTLSYFSSLELYFKKSKQLSVINIKKMECNVSMLHHFFYFFFRNLLFKIPLSCHSLKINQRTQINWVTLLHIFLNVYMCQGIA